MNTTPSDRATGASTLGYKHAKYLTTLDVSYARPVRAGYWSDQAYSWYAGL